LQDGKITGEMVMKVFNTPKDWESTGEFSGTHYLLATPLFRTIIKITFKTWHFLKQSEQLILGNGKC
jgi:hypothetical protein